LVFLEKDTLMKQVILGLLAVIGVAVGVSSAEALVLCANPSGSVVALAQCKAGMSQINPAAVGLVGPAGPQGPLGPQGPQGVQGAPGDSSSGAILGTKSLSEITKYYGGRPWTTVVTVDLPAGTYLLKGNGVVNRVTHPGGSGIAVQCRLTGGGTTLPFSYFSGPALETTSVALSGRVNLDVTDTATIECSHIDFDDTIVEGVDFELLAQQVTVQVNP
jgi:hypothetical protein